METRLYIYIVRVTLKRDCESGSDSDHGVDIDSNNASTSHSHIDSDGHSRFDNIMVISDRENDNNSYRHSYCYSDSEWQLRWQVTVWFCGAVRREIWLYRSLTVWCDADFGR